MVEHHITVPRTARYHTLGEAGTASSAWVVLHGYGQLARYFLRKFEGLEEGRLIIAPEGLSRFYLDEGHTRVGASWMTREDREREIRDQISYLDLLADELRSANPTLSSMNVLGFSQGVATACRWATLGRSAISRLVIWGGTLPPDLGVAVLASRLSRCRIDIVQGDTDPLVPPGANTAAEARWRDAGLVLHPHSHPGGHDLDTLLLERLFLG